MALNNNAGPYGAEKQVIKEECINHVHKRMGTALRKLVKETTEEYVTKSGHVRQKKMSGRNRLTEMVIEKMTDYYGVAVRKNANKTVEEMSRDIWATYYHCSSSDEKHDHSYCPTGKKSWCFWNRAIAEKREEQEEKRKMLEDKAAEVGEPSTSVLSFYGSRPAMKKTEIKVKDLPSHTTMKVKFSLEKGEMRKLKDGYSRLTDHNLLKRCLQGKTQNPNESLHSRIWNICPKVKSFGKQSLEFAVAQAVINYNIGYVEGYLGKELGIENYKIKKHLAELDKTREQVVKHKPPKRRKLMTDPSYAPGDF